MTRQSFYTAQRPMRGNGFRQDRELIRAGHHSGIVSFVQEDAIVCMSAGGLRDRQYEHLGTADMAVAQMYRTLHKSAKQVADGGKPIGYNLSVADLRGARTPLAVGPDWRTASPKKLRLAKASSRFAPAPTNN